MPKEEWGTKRVCPTTGKRFYDLKKSPVVSPYTGEVVNIETGKASRVMVADKPDSQSKKAEEPLVEDEEVAIEETEDEDSDIDLGDDILDDDDDDDNVPLEEIADVAGEDEE